MQQPSRSPREARVKRDVTSDAKPFLSPRMTVRRPITPTHNLQLKKYSRREIQRGIIQLEDQFSELKDTAISLLNENFVEVKEVVHKLTDLRASARSEHESFIEERLDRLEQCTEHKELFSRLNPHWDYLSPQLLQHLITKFDVLSSVQRYMDEYEGSLSDFRTRTFLKLFGELRSSEYIAPEKEFSNMFSQFQRETSFEMTLEDVEEVRYKYGRRYKLRKFALMLFAKVRFKSQRFEEGRLTPQERFRDDPYLASSPVRSREQYVNEESRSPEPTTFLLPSPKPVLTRPETPAKAHIDIHTFIPEMPSSSHSSNSSNAHTTASPEDTNNTPVMTSSTTHGASDTTEATSRVTTQASSIPEGSVDAAQAASGVTGTTLTSTNTTDGSSPSPDTYKTTSKKYEGSTAPLEGTEAVSSASVVTEQTSASPHIGDDTSALLDTTETTSTSPRTTSPVHSTTEAPSSPPDTTESISAPLHTFDVPATQPETAEAPLTSPHTAEATLAPPGMDEDPSTSSSIGQASSTPQDTTETSSRLLGIAENSSPQQGTVEVPCTQLSTTDAPSTSPDTTRAPSTVQDIADASSSQPGTVEAPSTPPATTRPSTPPATADALSAQPDTAEAFSAKTSTVKTMSAEIGSAEAHSVPCDTFEAQSTPLSGVDGPANQPGSTETTLAVAVTTDSTHTLSDTTETDAATVGTVKSTSDQPQTTPSHITSSDTTEASVTSSGVTGGTFAENGTNVDTSDPAASTNGTPDPAETSLASDTYVTNATCDSTIATSTSEGIDITVPVTDETEASASASPQDPESTAPEETSISSDTTFSDTPSTPAVANAKSASKDSTSKHAYLSPSSRSMSDTSISHHTPLFPKPTPMIFAPMHLTLLDPLTTTSAEASAATPVEAATVSPESSVHSMTSHLERTVSTDHSDSECSASDTSEAVLERLTSVQSTSSLQPILEDSGEEVVATKKGDPESPGFDEMPPPGFTPTTSTPVPHSRQRAMSEDYSFVMEPPQDHFCPVTLGLMLEPHQTLCCGSHLSKEVAIRLQTSGKPCPMCKATSWSSVLDKYFLRRVRELRVYCHYKEWGCGWQGELLDLERHISSCPVYNSMGEESKSKTLPLPPLRRSASLDVQCCYKKKACSIFTRGSATTDGTFAYFTPNSDNTVHKYHLVKDEWEELPPCPCSNSGLVMIKEKQTDNSGNVKIKAQLTAVGGNGANKRTNKLHSLIEEKWVEVYPPMLVRRSQPAVLITPDSRYVVVIGGDEENFQSIKSVEALHIENKRWYALTDLPRALYRPSATICQDKIHVIGGDIGYSFSLSDLPSDQELHHTDTVNVSWTKLPKLPVKLATAATLCDELVAICGWKRSELVGSIYQLLQEEWVEIGTTSRRQHSCLVTSKSRCKLIIVGAGREESHVEECIAQNDCIFGAKSPSLPVRVLLHDT